MTMPPVDAAAVFDAPLLTLAGGSSTLRARLGPASGTGALVAVFVRHFG
jgi:hypothetical protein